MEKNFIIAGFGGQGVLLAGEVLANAFMIDGKNVTWYPSYGAEMRGGTVNCEIVMSEEEVSSVNKSDADFVIALNQASFDRFLSKIKKGGWMIANSSLAKEIKSRTDINYVFAPITKLAENVGNIKMANILALGLLAKTSKLVSLESLTKALDIVIPPHRKNLLPLNIEALKIGYEYDLLPV
ncbi:putative 2-oxoglutarate ferredoxin oxidoreductase gamma subunit [Clostridium sp. CAG:967]|nr:putative 2-oxoglutarate ferredoxin oxidoreductase gamma subunit [Clostridium sp. CAG:967]